MERMHEPPAIEDLVQEYKPQILQAVFNDLHLPMDDLEINSAGSGLNAQGTIAEFIVLHPAGAVVVFADIERDGKLVHFRAVGGPG